MELYSSLRSTCCFWLCKYAVPPAGPAEGCTRIYRARKIDSTLVHPLRYAQVCCGQTRSQLYDTCVSREQSPTPAPGPHYRRKGHNHIVRSLIRSLPYPFPIPAFLFQADVASKRLSRLSLHFSQASEALRNWGLGEGDDLLARGYPLQWRLFLTLCLSGYTRRLYQAPSRILFFSQTVCYARENHSRAYEVDSDSRRKTRSA